MVNCARYEHKTTPYPIFFPKKIIRVAFSVWRHKSCVKFRFHPLRQCFKWGCFHKICSCCSNLIFWAFQNSGSKSRHSVWNMFFLPGKLSERQDMWWWSSQQNIHIKKCLINAWHNYRSEIPQTVISVKLGRWKRFGIFSFRK